MANAGCQLELQRLKRNHKPPAVLQQQRDSSGGGRQQSLQEVAGGQSWHHAVTPHHLALQLDTHTPQPDNLGKLHETIPP